MRPIYWLPLSSALLLILTGCANNSGAGNSPDGTGPFDADGNYHEEWANDPSKWSKPGKRSKPNDDLLPLVAKNEQPPPTANPLAPQGSTRAKTTSRTTVAEVTREPQRETAHTNPKTTSRPTTRSKEKSTTHVAQSKPKTKPKTTAKTSSKAKTTRHTVKPGDSLWLLARRYGTSVSAIQKANGLSGTNIRDGRTLVIPKR